MLKRRTNLWFLIVSVLVAVLFCADIMLGSETISPREVWNTMLGHAEPLSGSVYATIIFKYRIPKALVALVAGAALAASGLQMQTLFRNPLAGPFVLGVSSGASLGVAIFLMGMPLMGLSASADIFRNIGVVGSAWIGSAAILFIVMAVAARIKNIMAVLILGMMFGSAATAFVEILQFMSPEGTVKSFVIWTMGSLGNVSLQQLWIMVTVAFLGLVISVVLIKPLNVLMLGENYARTMGLSIGGTRTLIFVSTILLAGTVTAFCGPIGFLGVAVPHVARMLFSEADHRILMPASMLLGSGLLLLCDIISQLPGYEMTLPINTITALLGIPVVVIVIIKSRKAYL